MTANNKIGLLVKEDGSAQLLIPGSTKKPKYKNATRVCRILFVTVLFGLFAFGCFSAYTALHKRTNLQLEYNVYYPSHTVWKKGKMGFNEDESLSMFVSENVITLSDGYAHTTAVKINTTTPGLEGAVCLVRNDQDYGTESARILPKQNMLDTLMKKTISERRVDVVMHQDVWVPDVFNAVDFNHLPLPVQELCDGVPIYLMIPKEDDTDESDEYDDDSDDVDSDDDVSPDDDDESDNDGESDDDDEALDDPATITTYLNNKNEIDFNAKREKYSESREESPSYHGLPPLNLPNDDWYDDDDEDDYEDNYYESTTTTYDEQTTYDDGWVYRRKRQVAGDHRDQPRADPDESLNLGEAESDANLQCCHHCRRPYLQCSQVCVPIQQLTYPYYYRSCNYVQCSVIMPCLWWKARAAGIV